jgi:hypothetical protein
MLWCGAGWRGVASVPYGRFLPELGDAARRRHLSLLGAAPGRSCVMALRLDVFGTTRRLRRGQASNPSPATRSARTRGPVLTHPAQVLPASSAGGA